MINSSCLKLRVPKCRIRVLELKIKANVLPLTERFYFNLPLILTLSLSFDEL